MNTLKLRPFHPGVALGLSPQKRRRSHTLGTLRAQNASVALISVPKMVPNGHFWSKNGTKCTFLDRKWYPMASFVPKMVPNWYFWSENGTKWSFPNKNAQLFSFSRTRSSSVAHLTHYTHTVGIVRSGSFNRMGFLSGRESLPKPSAGASMARPWSVGI